MGETMRVLRHHLPHFLMIAPFLVLFGAFFLYPILSGLYYSFHDWNGVREPVYVGLENYTRLLGSRDFSRAMWNLFQYIVITVPLGLTVAFCPCAAGRQLHRALGQLLPQRLFPAGGAACLSGGDDLALDLRAELRPP